MKYVDSKWQCVADEDAYKLMKLEGQVIVSSTVTSHVTNYYYYVTVSCNVI